MNHRILTTLLMAGVAAWTAQAKPQSKPNIIVVFTDDHGFSDLGVHGQAKDVKTPHLDALAKSGVTCTAGYITAPQCGALYITVTAPNGVKIKFMPNTSHPETVKLNGTPSLSSELLFGRVPS